MEILKVAIVLGSTALFAQSQPPALSFEVATVKVAPRPARNGGLFAVDTDPAMVRYSNITLKNLIAVAYRLDSRLILGGPAWLDNDPYEVVAKLPPGTLKDRVPLMLQTLLAERFRLAVHREMRVQRVYFLVVGKNGPKLKDAPQEDGQDAQRVRGDRPPVQILPGRITGHAAPLSALASTLAYVAGRQTVDRTQLAGAFDFDLLRTHVWQSPEAQ